MWKHIIGWLGILFSLATPAANVVVTIKPIHALVSGVMDKVGTPILLLQGGGSPHTYSLKPSQVKQLREADLVVWMGLGIERFLEKSLATLPSQTKQLSLATVTGLTLLKVREGGAWQPHSHHNASDSDHEEQFDQHLWLDPDNAKIMVKAITAALSQIDAANAARYHDNATHLTERLAQFDQELKVQLAATKNIPFLVFHDAYQYFEQHYGLTAVGAITLSPEQSPSVKRVHELRSRIKDLQVHCVFSEPQFEPALVTTLIEDTSARRGTLDPLGAELQAGTEAYFSLLRKLANSFNECLLAKGTPK